MTADCPDCVAGNHAKHCAAWAPHPGDALALCVCTGDCDRRRPDQLDMTLRSLEDKTRFRR